MYLGQGEVVQDLYWSQPQGGDLDALARLLGVVPRHLSSYTVQELENEHFPQGYGFKEGRLTHDFHSCTQ